MTTPILDRATVHLDAGSHHPLAWEEYAASALYSRRPVSPASVRKAWEAEQRRAAERARQEAGWAAERQEALEAGGSATDDGAWPDADDDADPF